MTIYADTPRWERYGTVWGHLISDTSVEELHAAAQASGLHPRSFDLDHYDWPAAVEDRLRAVGTVFVGNAELTRILIRSGLRIPARSRPAMVARRTQQAASALGLSSAPTELVWGSLGHVAHLPPKPVQTEGTGGDPSMSSEAFRLSCDESWRIEAHTEAGHLAAQEYGSLLDMAARAVGYPRFVGQVLALTWPCDARSPE